MLLAGHLHVNMFFFLCSFWKVKEKAQLCDLSWRISILCLSVFLNNKRLFSLKCCLGWDTSRTIIFACQFLVFVFNSVCVPGGWDGVYCAKTIQIVSGKLSIRGENYKFIMVLYLSTAPNLLARLVLFYCFLANTIHLAPRLSKTNPSKIQYYLVHIWLGLVLALGL